MAAEQVGRRRGCSGCFSGLTKHFPCGTAVWTGVDRHRLLRRGPGDRLLVPRRGVLQISLPDRAVQLRAVADVAAGNQSARTGAVHIVCDERLHSRRDESRSRWDSRMRIESLSAPQGRQQWTAPSASIASTPARTTISGSSSRPPARNFGTIRSVPASAGSAGAPIWRRWC